jgi:hypothetical protein
MKVQCRILNRVLQLAPTSSEFLIIIIVAGPEIDQEVAEGRFTPYSSRIFATLTPPYVALMYLTVDISLVSIVINNQVVRPNLDHDPHLHTEIIISRSTKTGAIHHGR